LSETASQTRKYVHGLLIGWFWFAIGRFCEWQVVPPSHLLT